MAQDTSEIFKNYKKEIAVVRGKKYTFKISSIDQDGSKHPFYITTDPNGGPGFPGLITENVEHSYERVSSPNLLEDIST